MNQGFLFQISVKVGFKLNCPAQDGVFLVAFFFSEQIASITNFC
jgi:hypothetical protein